MILNVYGTAVKIKDNKLMKEFLAKQQQIIGRGRTPSEFSPQFDIAP
jgi:hypothetical protein